MKNRYAVPFWVLRGLGCIMRLLVLGGIAAPAAQAQQAVNYADWQLERAEEFNTPIDTTALAARWRFYYPWGHAINPAIESGYYTAEEVHTNTGKLALTARQLATPRQYQGRPMRYQTGMLFSRHPVEAGHPYGCNAGDGFSYGLFEVRARQPRSPTSFPAFWLFGGAPDEIDVFEADAHGFSNNFHLAPSSYWRPSRRQELACDCFFYNADPAGNLSAQYHTYGVSWLPTGVTFYYDGIPIRHETRLIPAGCAMSVIVNIAALNWSNHPTDTLSIDYIRIYRLRQLPAAIPVLRPGAEFPQSELMWLPAETQPGRADQSTYQAWQLAPLRPSGGPAGLALRLTDNYNPPCSQAVPLPLPIAGRWAPAWVQTNGLPELRIRLAGPDSVRWQVCDLRGRPMASGTAMSGDALWHPRWEMLPPGSYVLHLRQRGATLAHPLVLFGRVAGSAPDVEWGRATSLRPGE